LLSICENLKSIGNALGGVIKLRCDVDEFALSGRGFVNVDPEHAPEPVIISCLSQMYY
jgi:hypothetical protein